MIIRGVTVRDHEDLNLKARSGHQTAGLSTLSRKQLEEIRIVLLPPSSEHVPARRRSCRIPPVPGQGYTIKEMA